MSRISVGSDTITNQVTIANKLGSYFTSVLSSDSLNSTFKHFSDNAAAFLVTSPFSFNSYIMHCSAWTHFFQH
jgi:methylthioribose-1-phosphate isomerase